MTVQTDLNETWEKSQQSRDAFVARATLEGCSREIDACHETIQELVDSGQFDTIPQDMKVALNQWWTIMKTARAAIGGNADIMTLLNWTPPSP